MGVYGEFIYGGESVGGDVYGPDVGILAADLIAADAVRVNFDLPVVVDEAYNDATNYSVAVVSGSGQSVSVRSVLPIFDDTTQEVILVIDKVSKGTTYTVSVNTNITSTAGQSVVGSAQFVGRRTKVENMCRSLPSHFNTFPDSCVRSILTAIGLSDETIGGSLDESIFDEVAVVAPPIAWEPGLFLPEAEGWWRADKGIAHILLEITNWVNQGSEPTLDLAQAIVSRRPDLVAAVAALNGQAGAFFDGVNVMASIATAAWELAADGDDLTVVVFLEPTAGSIGGVVSVDAAGSGGFTVRARSGGPSIGVTRDSSGGGFLIPSNASLSLVPHVFSLVYSGQVAPTVDSAAVWLDGVSGGAVTLNQLRINSSLSPQEFIVGAESLTGTNGFIGHIAEILFLRRLLTSDEDVLLTNYANARYGMVFPGITQ